MTHRAVARAVRRQVRERAGRRCEYCQHPDRYSSGPFVCEHVIPRVRGAGDTLDELAWACAGCNGYKYDKTHVPDPEIGRRVPVFNPRRQKWSTHFAWSADSLLVVGRTPTGRATIEALRLNRPELVNLRFALKSLGEHPPS